MGRRKTKNKIGGGKPNIKRLASNLWLRQSLYLSSYKHKLCNHITRKMRVVITA